MSKYQNRFSSETKIKAVLRLIKEEGNSVQIAQEIGCHASMVREWRDKFMASAHSIFENKQIKDNKGKKITDLEQLIGRLTVENDFLKKVSDHFNSR
jgi:transposase-like protein